MKISKKPNVLFGAIIVTISMTISINRIISDSLGFSTEGNLIILFTGCILGVIIGLRSKIFLFERITIETKGGKLIQYDVSKDNAELAIDKIEKMKRKITGVQSSQGSISADNHSRYKPEY